MPENTVYVGRPTKWGNPFLVDKEMTDWQKAFIATQLLPFDQIAEQYKRGVFHYPLTLEKSLRYYEMYIDFQIRHRNLDLSELKGKDLACWCLPDQPCHAVILLKLANPDPL